MSVVSISGGGRADVTVYGKGTVIGGSGDDSIRITGVGKVLVGAGHDTISMLGGGLFQEIGPHGHDTISVGDSHVRAFVQGDATVTGAFGTVHVHAGSVDSLLLSGHRAVIEDAGGSSTMIGGKGSVEFLAGWGHHEMIGGPGHDIFAIVGVGKGTEVIDNFVHGKDRLLVEGHSLDYLKSHHDISVHGGNTFIHIGDTSIELKGITLLKSSDFITHK